VPRGFIREYFPSRLGVNGQDGFARQKVTAREFIFAIKLLLVKSVLLVE